MPAHRPDLIVFAGPNGSGKTTLTNIGRQHHWAATCLYINPDDIARDQFGDWNSPDAVLKAARTAEAMREDCLRTGRPFMFETVFSTVDKVQFLMKAKRAGFFIRFFFVGTEHPDINVRRVATRVAKGGHDVPEDRIRARYYRSINNAIAGLAIADRGYLYDNSIEDTPARLIFRTNDGHIEKVYADDIPEWTGQVMEALYAHDVAPGDDHGR